MIKGMCVTGGFYPPYLILITISVLAASHSVGNHEYRRDVIKASLKDNKSYPYSFSDALFDQDVEGTINVPIQTCDSSQQRKYADLTTVHVNPPCEESYQGFCGIRRNQNYTLIIKFLPKVSTKGLTVRVTSIDPSFGWETQIWPEFSVCSAKFNITCPPSPNTLVHAFLHRAVPEGVPSMRALVRVRLFGKDEGDFKRLFICRQFNLQLY